MEPTGPDSLRATEPGVVVARRSFLRLAVAALAVVPVARWSPARAVELLGGELTFDNFLSEAVPVARALVSDPSRLGQDRYLLTLAALAVRLAQVPVPEMRDSGQGVGPGTFIGFNPGGDPFTVLHWRMEPGTRIRTHAHTYGNVLTLGLEGSAEVENYEVEGVRDFASKDSFRVRRTRRQPLGRHDVNLVNLEHDYIHGSRAGPQGARGLDITTRLHPKEPTPYLELLGDTGADLIPARWRFD